MGGIRIVALALVVALAAPTAADETASRARPDVVIIVLDACRADRMGFLGNPQWLTPFLDAVAARSYVFRRAYTAASYTPPSIASLFTSRLPSHHGTVWFGSHLREEETTLADVLARNGAATGGFTGNLLFHGAGRGFDTFKGASAPDGTGGHVAVVNAPFLAWWKRLRERTPPPVSRFVYLHYMDTHAPYRPPPTAVTRLAGRPVDVARVNNMLLPWTMNPPSLDQLSDLQYVVDASVASADTALQNFFTVYGPPDLLRNAIVVVTADHGDGLGEHREVGHGLRLYETTLRVPLLIKLPGQSTRVDVDEVVSLIDVAPTVLDLLDLPRPPSWEGESLLPAMERAAHPWRAATLWWDLHRRWTGGRIITSESPATTAETGGANPLHRAAVVRGTEKAIAHFDGTRSYFDLAADPDENRPDALSAASRRTLDHALDRILESATARRPAPADLDDAMRERLRALGYTAD